MSTLFVLDLSMADMLIRTGSTVVAIDGDEALLDIIISIPEHGANTSRTLLSIETGMVVCSFFEEKNNAYCHGVASLYENPNVREALGQLAPAGE